MAVVSRRGPGRGAILVWVCFACGHLADFAHEAEAARAAAAGLDLRGSAPEDEGCAPCRSDQKTRIGRHPGAADAVEWRPLGLVGVPWAWVGSRQPECGPEGYPAHSLTQLSDFIALRFFNE